MSIKWVLLISMFFAAMGPACKQTSSSIDDSSVQGACSGGAARLGGLDALLANVRNNPLKNLEDLPLNRTVLVLGRAKMKSLLGDKLASFDAWLTNLSRDINHYGPKSWDEIKAITDNTRETAMKSKKAWDDLLQGYNTIKTEFSQNFATPSNIYRGMRLDAKSMQKFLEAMTNKTTMTLGRDNAQAWASGSRRPSSAYSFAQAGKNQGEYNVLLVLNQRSGLAVESIEKIGDMKEVLIPPMARFKVTAANPLNNKNGNEFVLYMEEI